MPDSGKYIFWAHIKVHWIKACTLHYQRSPFKLQYVTKYFVKIWNEGFGNLRHTGVLTIINFIQLF